jgi:hypothetical protein
MKVNFVGRWMFANECFVRGRKDLLQSIQRRKPTTNQTIMQSKGEEQSPCTMPPLGSWPTPTMPKIVPGQVSGFSAFNLPFPVAAPMNANMSQTSVPFSSVLGQIGGLPPTLSGFGLSPNSWQQQLDVSAWQQKQLHCELSCRPSSTQEWAYKSWVFKTWSGIMYVCLMVPLCHAWCIKMPLGAAVMQCWVPSVSLGTCLKMNGTGCSSFGVETSYGTSLACCNRLMELIVVPSGGTDNPSGFVVSCEDKA